MSADEQVVQIQIPEGVQAGGKLNIPLEDGRTFEIFVPAGVNEGEVINVVIPSTNMSTYKESSADQDTANGDEKSPKTISGSRVALGAAAATGILATLVIGPVTGIVCAVIGVYATTRDDKIGDIARSTGAATANAYDKAVETESKYGIKDKIKNAGIATYEKAKEINSEYMLTEKANAMATATYTKAVEINEEYKVVDKSKATVSSIASQAKELNEKYEITNKASKAITSSITTAKELDQKYEITSKASKAVTAGITSSMNLVRALSSRGGSMNPESSIPVAEAKVEKY
mmetsp:Transcript_39984/g.40788  ORF Transcript_39984/g.40788 Transcript_39984/m.40788 type:complete len:290 (+) Transcript_39984:77-946(+)|eukprot:CAMPEP_0182416578 /NCGR_PEP_ID=MMETSP1167-20130531/932_1 /TAXON_ID=2988 /ORGANISM="Mallomonas Sp, Strain CCMP3275" /LENGTH=289 /DNA_ID=CAMNT_0024589489 /DNA_START=73 /DNA_END=942 /DNA_ORIENTATION=-